jgi:hypothetical protein
MYLGIFWFQNRMDASLRPEIDILRLFAGFVTAKGSASRMLRHEPFMPSSYYQIDEVLEYLLDNCISKHAKTVPYRLAPEPLNDDFQYRSQFAESLLYMLVRRRWKQHVKYLWPFYTRIAKEDFIIENSDDFFSWRCKNVRSITQQVKRKADWGDLLKFAEEIDIKSVPFELREDPILLLLILYVMPHRASTELISWLDYEINRIPWW